MPVKARLFTPPWNGESALVLMLTSVGSDESKGNFEAALQQAKAEARELPAVEGTSRLSPHLAFGEISPRQVWRAASARGFSAATDKFLAEQLHPHPRPPTLRHSIE